MSQKVVLLKVSIVTVSLNSMFLRAYDKSFMFKKAWSLPPRTLQSRHRDNTGTGRQIINDKRMERIQILFEVTGIRENFELRQSGHVLQQEWNAA